jgi:hypothetical protein
VRAEPDGYTIQMTVLTNVFNTTLYTNLKFNFGSDIAHVAGVANAPYVAVVSPMVPAKTDPGIHRLRQGQSGKINMASGGPDRRPTFSASCSRPWPESIWFTCPYRGNYMPDLLAGQVQFAINPIPQALELVRTGKLTALAVTTTHRLAAFAGPADRRRRRAGLRGARLVCAGRAEETRRPRSSTSSTRRRMPLSPIPSSGAAGRPGRRADADDAAKFASVHRERDRHVDQGDQVRRRRAGDEFAANRSVTWRSAAQGAALVNAGPI